MAARRALIFIYYPVVKTCPMKVVLTFSALAKVATIGQILYADRTLLIATGLVAPLHLLAFRLSLEKLAFNPEL